MKIPSLKAGGIKGGPGCRDLNVGMQQVLCLDRARQECGYEVFPDLWEPHMVLDQEGGSTWRDNILWRSPTKVKRECLKMHVPLIRTQLKGSSKGP